MCFCFGFIRIENYISNIRHDNKENLKNFLKIYQNKNYNLQSKKNIKAQIKGLVRALIQKIEIFPNHIRVYLKNPTFLHKGSAFSIPNIRLRMFFSHVDFSIKKNDFLIKKISSIENKIKIGDIILLNACLYKPKGEMLPGSYNMEKSLLFRNIFLTGYTRAPIKHVLKRNHISYEFSLCNIFSYKFLDSWRCFLRSKILQEDKIYNINQKSIILALTTGEKTLIPKQLRNSYAQIGIAHILAISGLHMVTLALIVACLCKLILAFFPFFGRRFDTRRFVSIVILMISSIYLLLCLDSISAQRAYIMTCGATVALLLYHHYCAVSATMFASFIILIFDPTTIFSISFQLSFVAVLVLTKSYTFLYTKVNNENKDSSLLRIVFLKICYFFLSIFWSSLVVTVATAPIIAYYFHYFSLNALLTNFIAIPITTFFTMPLLFLQVIFWHFDLNFFETPLYFGINLLNKCAQNMNIFTSFKFTFIPPIYLFLSIVSIVLFTIGNRIIQIIGMFVWIIVFIIIICAPYPRLIIKDEGKFICFVQIAFLNPKDC